MKKRTYIILTVCLLIIAVCVGLFIFLRKRAKENEHLTGLIVDNSDNTPGNSDSVLKLGSRGENVKKLQRYLHGQLVLAPIYDKAWPTLNGTTINSLVVDGIFGEKTECACQWWFGRTSVKTSEIPESL